MFLDKDFLLTNEFGKKLFHDYSQKMPIIDYHNHLDPKVIYENKNFEDLTQAWLYDNGAGDHYKWRLLRTEGFDESLITGDAPSYEKYLAFVKTLKKAMGNPIFEWSHLELRRYFGIEEVLTEENAKEIWDKANALLQTDDFKPRALLKRMNITAMCTTDDPIDDLNYHKLIKEEGIGFKVLPTFRPDFVFDIEGNAFVEYLEKLTNLTRYEVSDFSNLEKALDARVAYFHEVGGRLSDHGLNTFHYISTSQEEANRIMQKRLQGTSLTREEVLKYQSALQIALMKIYVKHGWAMQLHMNALRNDSAKSFKEVGINAGFDSMGDQTGLASEFVKCFSDAELENAVPKTVVYSLNENDYL
ncbi:MAG: glucuronate isomerase, partial [Streptococcaceae bacterium]|nr:glucuronate isomerase [Streptococcaceae bacterium]